MASESLLQELQDTQLAVELISLGARMQWNMLSDSAGGK